MTIYICPVCSALFDDELRDQTKERTVHCLQCNHHYPLDNGRCHNCNADKKNCYEVQPTTLTIDDVMKLSDWSADHGYKRGVEMLYLPGGQVYEGGIRIK